MTAWSRLCGLFAIARLVVASVGPRLRRTADEPFAIPQFALTRSDVDSFMDELRGFHSAFRACFARQEPRDQFFNYMVAQFSPLERKSIEPMALRVEGGKVRAM